MANVLMASPVSPAELESGKQGLSTDDDDVPKAVDLFSFLLCLNTISDIGVIFVLADQGFETSFFFIILGLIIAGLLRGIAVYQYYGQAGILVSVVNFVLGSRFSLKSRDPEKMNGLPLAQQLGDPYILHIISDDIQNGFSGYACFLALSVVPDNDHVVIIAATLLTGLCILARLAEKEPYGKMIKLANIFLWYASLFFLFSVLAIWTEELEEDKIYTKDLTYGWARFLVMTGCGGIDLAIYQRKPVEQRSQVPTLMSIAAIVMVVADIAFMIVFKSDVTVFSEFEDPLLLGLIYTNIVVDGLMAVHSFIAYRT